MTKAIVYLHGFQSSPLSFKAQLVSSEIEKTGSDVQCFCPQLSLSPAKSMEMVKNFLDKYSSESIAVIGSSLGGYYANWLAECYGCKAVLLNPVVNPWKIKILDDLPDRSDLRVREWLDFRENYQSELEAIRIAHITKPDRYMLLAATGDELLDWRLMQSHYQGAAQTIIEGGDHGLSCFVEYLGEVLRFCGIKTATA